MRLERLPLSSTQALSKSNPSDFRPTCAVVGLLWMFPGIADVRNGAIPAHTLHALLGFTLAAVMIVSGFLFGPPDNGKIDGVSSGALIAYLIGAGCLVIASSHNSATLIAFGIL